MMFFDAPHIILAKLAIFGACVLTLIGCTLYWILS